MMERLAAIGASWRHLDLARLAELSAPPERRVERAAALAAALGARELVHLATCNRVEVAFVPPPGAAVAALRARAFEALAGRAPAPGEAERTLRAWSDEGAVEHVFCVASGLDSAELGETEISGQVRRAVDEARAAGTLGATLEPLYAEALRLARRVRGATAVGAGRTSLAELALEAVKDRLAAGPGAVLLVGVSPMTERAGRGLAALGVPLCVANRTLARAHELARALERAGAPRADARSLGELADRPDAFAAAICATAAPGPVLARAALERLAARAPSGRPPLVVDLAVPPDVDPDDAARAGVERVGLDELTARAAATRGARVAAAGDARCLVDQALERWRRARAERALAPLLAALHGHYRETARSGVERLFRRDLAGLGPTERDAVARWAEALARRFAHLPATGLRELAVEHGPDALDVFARRADDGLARALAAALRGERREEPA